MVSSCAHIPATDVPFPDDPHEGWDLAICMAVSKRRQDACCGYSKPGRSLVVCTDDGGDSWVVQEPEEAPAEPEPDLSL